MKLKHLLFSSLILLFSGCCSTFCEPQQVFNNIEKECPKFSTESFKKQDDITVKNVTSYVDNNISYIKQPKEDYLNLLKDYKELKYNYNTLLDNLNKFNSNVK